MADLYSLNQGGAVDNSAAPDDFPEVMDDEQFAAAVQSAIDDAVDYIDGYVAPQRAQATQFYRGDAFGNEEPGRSQFVMTEVRDTVLSMMPGLLRISAVPTRRPRSSRAPPRRSTWPSRPPTTSTTSSTATTTASVSCTTPSRMRWSASRAS